MQPKISFDRTLVAVQVDNTVHVMLELQAPSSLCSRHTPPVDSSVPLKEAVTEKPISTPTPLTERFTRAVDYARILHAADVRKQTVIPYLSHVLAVSSIVLEHGGSEDQAIAALLHDAGEDHGGERRIAAIRAEFGDTVANIVHACSDDLPADSAAKRGWWERKVEYLAHLAIASPEVALVSAADKLHNARAILTDHRDLGGELWSRFNPAAGRSGSLWYYQRLAEIFRDRLAANAPQLARELAATVRAIIDDVHLVEQVSEATPNDEMAHALTIEATENARLGRAAAGSQDDDC